MKKTIFGVCAIFIFALTGSAQASSVFSDDFNDGDTDGWALSSRGNWSIDDGKLQQSFGASGGGEDHVMGFVEDIETSDQSIKTDVKTDGYGGVVFWHESSSNFVSVFVYPGHSQVMVLEQRNGVEYLSLYNHPASYQWQELKVDANSISGNLDIYIDNQFVATHNSNTLHRYGKSGITSGNSGAYFDNFSLTIVPEIPTSKMDCKKDNWMNWEDPTFRNQGQCIRYVQKTKNLDATE